MLLIGINLLLLLLAANGAPILVAKLLGTRANLAVDFGASAFDGRPLLGHSKTWRGVAAALASAALLSALFGYGTGFGLVFGSLVVLGDLVTSFAKRRRGLPPSGRSIGWDHLLESLLPSLYAVQALGYPWWWSLPVCLVFILIGSVATGSGHGQAGSDPPV